MKYKIEVKSYEIKVAEKESVALSSPETVFNIMKDSFSPISEEMHLLILNVKNQIIDKILISKGTYNSVMVTPLDIIRPLMLMAGNNFILSHNHPSGDVSPSEEDINFTSKIMKATKVVGLNMLDHVIYGSDNHYSFKKNGLM